MTYQGNCYPIHPEGQIAGLLCEIAAELATTCGYPDCDDEAVVCAVHPTHITGEWMTILAKLGLPEHELSSKPGSQFLPVCERHKGWEQAKFEGTGWSVFDGG